MRKPNIPSQCHACLRFDDTRKTCVAFVSFYKENCPSRILNYEKYLHELEALIKANVHNHKALSEFKNEYKRIKFKYNIESKKQIAQCYKEDVHRGSPGSKSEGGGRENKAILNDNKIRECKEHNREIKPEYDEKLKAWEEENGPLEKHKSIGYGIARNKKDTYVDRDTDKFGIIPTDKEIDEAKNNLYESGIVDESILEMNRQDLIDSGVLEK